MIAKGIGIDPNADTTGIAHCWDNVIVSSTEIKGRPAKAFDGLITTPWLRMADAICLHLFKSNPDWIAVEGVYHGPNPKVTIILAQLIGAIQIYALGIGLPCFVMSTATIDGLTGVPRTERKLGNLYMAEKLLQTDVSKHEADAVAVAMAGEAKYKEKYLLKDITS